MSRYRRKLLITGATGLLGNTLIQEATDLYAVSGLARHLYQVTDSSFIHAVDLLDQKAVDQFIRGVEPDVVIHAAALTSIDQCEKDPSVAFATNVDGTYHLLNALDKSQCQFFFISTDSVFDGIRGNYQEEDLPSPIHVYGKSKFEAEKLVLKMRPNALVVRTSFYGVSPILGGRTQNIAEWILSRLRQGRTVPGFTDLFFSPIPVNKLAQLLLHLIEKGATGILHVAGSQSCSKFQFAQELAHVFHFSPDLIVETASDSAQLSAGRPKNVTLCVKKVTEFLSQPLPNLLEGLHLFHSSEPMMAAMETL